MVSKQFDSVPIATLWKVLNRFTCPDNFKSLVQAMQGIMSGPVFHQNILSKEFPIRCGLKYRCVVASTLFSLYLATNFHKTLDNPGGDTRGRHYGEP